MHNKIVIKANKYDPTLGCKKVSISFNYLRIKTEETNNAGYINLNLWLQGSASL